MLRLDHMLVDDTFIVEDVADVDLPGSDHRRVRRHALDRSDGAGRASRTFSITSGSDGWIQY